MPPIKKASLNLTAGSILHIEGFKGSGGFSAKNKFLIVVGWQSTNTVLAFRITSQTIYAESNLARELVFIPAGTDRCLKKDSYVQCFHEVERLDVGDLQAGWSKKSVTSVGNVAALLQQIRDVVEVSDVLSPQDIADVLAASAMAPTPKAPGV